MLQWESQFKKIDWGLIVSLLFLAIFSCTAIAAATHGNGKSIPSHVLDKQIIFEAIGFLMMIITAQIDYRAYKKWGLPVYILSILLLLLVFKMHTVNGAHSWISLGILSFQPSEIAKLAMILVLAKQLEQAEQWGLTWTKKLLLVLTLILPFVLTLKEPALGQALVMLVIIATMLMIHVKRTWIVLSILGLCFLLYLYMIQFPAKTASFIYFLIHHHVLKTYQANRILDWLTPSYHSLRSGYTINHTLTAIGAGGEFGQGIFHGKETNGNWIPNQWTDFIFSAVGEETGFIGASVLLLTFLLLLYRLVRYIYFTKDAFARYIVIGLMGMFGFQIFENIGMNIDLMPITGITLPFISYGGSSLVTNFIGMGICMNIHKQSYQSSQIIQEI